jgi:hypothetical protein
MVFELLVEGGAWRTPNLHVVHFKKYKTLAPQGVKFVSVSFLFLCK